MKYLIIHLIMFLFVTAPLGNIWGQEPTKRDDLSALLPHLDGLVPDGSLQKAKSAKSLFALINGGAELFVKYGFCGALFQTYKTKGNRFFNFEIFEMKNADAAHGVYTLKAESSSRKIKIGNEAVLGDYYLIFRKGRFYVSLTGFDSKKETMDELIAAAKSVEKKIEKYKSRPMGKSCT